MNIAKHIAAIRSEPKDVRERIAAGLRGLAREVGDADRSYSQAMWEAADIIEYGRRAPGGTCNPPAVWPITKE